MQRCPVSSAKRHVVFIMYQQYCPLCSVLKMNAYEGKKVVFSPGCKHHSSGLHHSHPLIKVKFVFDYQVFFVVLCDGRYPYDVPAEYNIHCITSHTHTYLHHHHFLTGEKSPPLPPSASEKCPNRFTNIRLGASVELHVIQYVTSHT